jgi:hypothetical protein
MRNVTTHGLHFAADQEGRVGGDLTQDVFEHNAIADAPVAFWVGRPRAHLKNAVNTRFGDVVLYKNDFRRGGAAFAGSKALEITGTGTSQWRAGNSWAGFEAGAEDPREPPAGP